MAHVLLIDHNPAFLPVQVRQAFPAPEHLVTFVTTGAAGIEQIRARPPDVVLLDVLVSRHSGFVVHEQIRAINALIPVIFISAAKTADTAIAAMKLGAFNYLHKPLDLKELRGVVAEGIEVTRCMRVRVPPPSRRTKTVYRSPNDALLACALLLHAAPISGDRLEWGIESSAKQAGNTSMNDHDNIAKEQGFEKNTVSRRTK